MTYPPPKFNSSPLKSSRNPIGKDRLPPFFRGELLNFGSVYKCGTCKTLVKPSVYSDFMKRNKVLWLYGFTVIMATSILVQSCEHLHHTYFRFQKELYIGIVSKKSPTVEDTDSSFTISLNFLVTKSEEKHDSLVRL